MHPISVFLTAPSFASARICSAHCPSVARALARIPFVSVTVVNVEFEGGDAAPAEAFGFLVPSSSCRDDHASNQRVIFAKLSVTIYSVVILLVHKLSGQGRPRFKMAPNRDSARAL